MQTLRGLPEVIEPLLVDQELIHYLSRRLAETDIEFWDWAVPFLGDDINVVLYADDLGMQDATAMSHDMFSTFFKPWHPEACSYSTPSIIFRRMSRRRT